MISQLQGCVIIVNCGRGFDSPLATPRQIKIENKNIKRHSTATTNQLILWIHQRLGDGQRNQGAGDAGGRLRRQFNDLVDSVAIGGPRQCWAQALEIRERNSI